MTKKAAATTQREREHSPKNILIVGDWVVDEHWLTGFHRSPTASRTSRVHIRSLHKPNSAVQTLAGAGRAASLLRRATPAPSKPVPFFDTIVCIGLWHTDDTATLQRMLDPAENSGQTPFRLTRRTDDRPPPKAKLINLGQADGGSEYGTDRVIRIYRRSGPKTELISRIDWEMPGESDELWPELMHVPKKKVLDSLKEKLGPDEIHAVLIKDLRKGAVSEAMIKFLAEKYPSQPWFVSTKAWKPDWMAHLKGVNVRLFIVPQVAANTAVREGTLSCWITGSGDLSKEALKAIDEISATFESSDRTIVAVLQGGASLLLKDQWRHDGKVAAQGYVQTAPLSAQFPVDLPMASVFFPSFVLKLLGAESLGPASPAPDQLPNILASSLAFTSKWVQTEGNRLKDYEWDPTKEPIVSANDDTPPSLLTTLKPVVWQKAISNWESAFDFKGMGIIEEAGANGRPTKRIDLWRAMTALDGYACCVDSKRRVIQQVANLLDRFKRTGQPRHSSCVLTASPGTGKTFMVCQLAKSFKFRPLQFNIAQLQDRNEILDCFDTIVMKQQEDPHGDPILVFVDEINAPLGGEPVYSSFLTPLENGVYVRTGKAFMIRPCVWVFAGTQSMNNTGDKARESKEIDFVSRLSLPSLDLELTPADNDMARLEKVYVAVSILTRVFSDVTVVSEKVLNLFKRLPLTFGIRELEHLIRALTDVQCSKVWSRNVPKGRLEPIRDAILLGEWLNMEEGDPVTIVSSAEASR